MQECLLIVLNQWATAEALEQWSVVGALKQCPMVGALKQCPCLPVLVMGQVKWHPVLTLGNLTLLFGLYQIAVGRGTCLH